jgi:hypothetical protein
VSGLQAIRIVGGIVPPSLLPRIQAGEVDPASLTPASYRLAGNETIRDAAARAWTYLRGAWAAWHDLDNPGAGATRDKWLLPLLRELGYGNVPALSHGLLVDDTSYPVSHAWEHVPIHLLGPGVSLDRRNPGVAGGARAPQAMLQEALNREEANLWAILSNGSKLRLLRDSTALAGSAYLEFDLDAIFEADLYAEFLLLFLLAHSTRLEKRGGSDAGPADCWLEAWRTDAVDTGTRALDRLRAGVEHALVDLGDGFLHHPSNAWLVTALRTGEVSDRDYLRALLRLVYRLLFTFVAEDRGALLDPNASPDAKGTYNEYFSTARLRRMARIRSGGPHPDLWQAQRLILGALGGDGLEQLGVPALGGLFDPDPRARTVTGQPGPDLLLGAELSNRALLSAIRHLAWVEVRGGRMQPVDYRNLGAEELGSVYESLLELIPRVDLEDMSFRLETTAGNDRKTTGSYYTPPGLVAALLDTALDPLLDEAVGDGKDASAAEQRLLALTVCDPACGSGGFLVAAARRIARCLAQVRSGEDEPTPEIVQHALRDVVGRCIYGVDLNDLAAELAKVSLWLEALEPGKPLGFLDARIRVGNSLLGTTPALLAGGIPDDAFKEIEGDDKKYAAAIRKQNKAERAGQSSLFAIDNTIPTATLAAERATVLANANDVDTARAQARAWADYEHSDAYQRAKLQADAWCAAFVWPLTPKVVPPVSEDAFQQITADPDATGVAEQVHEVRRIADEYRFFHWHLEFPEVFGDPGSLDVGPDGWPGGFTCLLGNPPWEHVELKEQEYFAARAPEIAAASGAKRKRLIAGLKDSDPPLFMQYLRDKRQIDGVRFFASDSGRYPLTGRGRITTDSVFAELWKALTAPGGRSGIIVPSGIATDATTQYFFKDLVQSQSLASLFDFENRAGIFPDVDSRMKFCLLTMSGRNRREKAASFAFFLHQPDQIAERQFALTPEEISLLNPNTGTCPIFRTRRDAETSLAVAKRMQPLILDEPVRNPWQLTIRRIFNFGTEAVSEMSIRANDVTGIQGLVPTWSGKMINQYDHRASSVYFSGQARVRQAQARRTTGEEHVDPRFSPTCGFFLPSSVLAGALPSEWNRDWLFAWCDVTSSTNERSLQAAVIPRVATDFSLRVGFPGTEAIASVPGLLAALNSFAVDYIFRQRVGGLHVSDYILKQLPFPSPRELQSASAWDLGASHLDWVKPRVLELTYTAWDMAPFAEDLGDVDATGRVNPPFVWDDERRFLLRCELDAAFFHLYGLDRDEVDYVMDTFPIVRRKDEAAHGEYRTKRVILEMYDTMAEAMKSGVPYETPISPPPGQGPRHPLRSS